jgi:DNA-directed RNA polymerase specialized sigma24 family protein
LTQFEASDPDKAAVVKLRFFGGLSMKEVAAAQDISVATADRHWAYARAWLLDKISPADEF